MDKQQYIEDSLNELIRKLAPILCFGGALIFLFLSALDYVSTPENFVTFLIYRILIAGLLFAVFLILYKFRFQNILVYKVLTYMAIVGSVVTIELMILKTGGHASSYYVGMSLVGIWVISFLPVSFVTSLVFMLTIYGGYVIPIAASETITNMRAFWSANAFLIALLSSSLILRHFHYRGLVNELGLKYDLEAYKDHLENLVSDRTTQLSASVADLQKEVEERTRAEEALKKAAEEWRTTFDSTNDVIMMLDRDLTVKRVNRAATAFYRRPYTEIIGKPFYELFHGDNLSDERDPLSLMTMSRKHEESELYCPDASIWARVSADPVPDEEGTIVGAVVIIKNVTTIKEMQDSIRKARDDWEETFNVINDAITIHDDNYNVIQANKAAVRLLGLSDYGRALPKCYQAYHGTESPPAYCGSCMALRTGESSVMELYEPHLSRFIEIKALPRYGSNGSIVGLVHVVRDITDRKNAEEEQKKLQAELLQIQKMDSIGRLAGGIAHDFNNILSAIIGFSHVALLKIPVDHPAAEPLKIIYEAGERAATLTRQLLAFSRKQMLEMKVININAIIEGMAKMLRRVIGERVLLDLRLQTPLKNILADSGQMEQVVMNLIVNARDAMPSGGRVSIATAELRAGDAPGQSIPPGNYALLAIADTGAGMTPEVQERMFEPFFTTKCMGKGTGLGLSTVYGIVKQHNGHLEVHSELGTGTTFKLFFPIVDREVEKMNPQKDSVLKRGAETVLVVDDEPSIRKLLDQTLQSLGYQVLDAASGEDAVTISNEYPGTIHLLVTDVVMPGMNGPQLAEVIRHRRPDMKVIYMSGYTGDAIIHQGVIDAGGFFLQKPLTPFVLANKVREVLDGNPESPRPVGSEKDLDGMRILYADDDESNRLLVRRHLEQSRCIPDICENGQMAVSRFRSGSYDLVLMDMLMPVMDGLTASREIRSWEAEQGIPATPIIALTGFASQEEIQALLDAGCTSYLTKPIKRDALMMTVSAYVSQRTRTRFKNDAERLAKGLSVPVDKDLKDLIPGYLQSRRSDAQKLQNAIAHRDYETIRILGHSMKGSGGGYGFHEITEFGAHIETAAKEQDLEGSKKWVDQLIWYLDHIEVHYE
jgi:PAS domain S-box-containing protein